MAGRAAVLKIIKWGGVFCLFGIVGAAGLTVWVYWKVLPGLPAVEQLQDVRYQVPLKVYSSDGVLIAEYGEKRREPLAIKDAPPQLLNAFIAAEDDRFWDHPGVDYQGLLRAGFYMLTQGQLRQGGSTITMQVARNFFLSSEKTFSRKITEIFLALQINRELTKEQVLELYINKIYLGNRAYGVAAAAQVYYGRKVSELSLAEMAMIAGLPKAPSAYNPLANLQRAMTRRNYVLKRLFDLEYIDESEYQLALAEPNTASKHLDKTGLDAGYLGEMARAKVVELFGEEEGYTGGYRVYLTADSSLQAAATRAVRKGLIAYEERHGFTKAVAKLPLQELLAGQKSKVGRDDSDAELADDEANILSGWEGVRQRLNEWPSYGDIVPAMVVAVEDKLAKVYSAQGQNGEIALETMSWARQRLPGDGRLGPVLKAVADVLAVGDVIYIQPSANGSFELVQLPEVEGALVSIDPQSGRVQALVGGFDFKRSKFNRAVQAFRQPGSNFKPFIYSAALEKGFTPATLINDAPVTFDDPALEGVWRPENYGGHFYGPTRMREALINSRNLVSVRILIALGVKYATDYALRFGFTREQIPRDLSLVLGSGAVSPWQLASAYSVFANGGFRIQPYLIERIEDGNGAIVYQESGVKVCADCVSKSVAAADSEQDAVDPAYAPRVIDQRNAYLVRSMLQDVIRHGTGRRALQLGRQDLAGKTGTTNDQRDTWFSGFNSELVTTTWLGFDSQKPLGAEETGGHSALPIWVDYMREALKAVPEDKLEQPDGIVSVLIDKHSGELTTAENPDRMFEFFKVEDVPTAGAHYTPVGGGADSGAGTLPPDQIF